MIPQASIPRPPDAYIISLNRGLPTPLDADELAVPGSPICCRALDFVQKALPSWFVNHSLRTYAWSLAIAQYAGFDRGPRAKELDFDRDLLFLSCILHELGFEQRQAPRSRLSLELWAAIKAKGWIAKQTDLIDPKSAEEMGDEALEAIAFHSLELRLVDGSARITQTLLGMGAAHDILANSTAFIHPATQSMVVDLYPRLGYISALREVTLNEVARKPGCLFEGCYKAFIDKMYHVEAYRELQGVKVVDVEWERQNESMPLL